MNSINKDKYDTYYKDEDQKWRKICSKYKAEMIAKLCDKNNLEKILEIGAGDGSVLESLERLNFGENYYALEISNSGVQEIKKKQISKLIDVNLFDGVKSKYSEKEFDLVIMSHVVEHVENPRQLIKEAKRIGKHLYIEVPCEENFRLSYDYKPDRTGHINFYNPKIFRRLLQTCHLKIEKENLYNPSLESYTYSNGIKGAFSYYLKSFLLKINKRFASKIFTYHFGVICKD